MNEQEMMAELVEAYGPRRADEMVVQTFGTIQAAFDYAVEEGMIAG